MKLRLSVFISFVAFAASYVRADFDPSEVTGLSVQVNPVAGAVEMSPAPLVFGEIVTPTATATLRDGSAGVPVLPEFITLASLNTNILRIDGGQIVACGYGVTNVSFKVGNLITWKSVKVVPPAGRLAHRYSFGTNADPVAVIDSVGTAHGWLTNATPSGTTPSLVTGEARFDGAGGYIALPASLASQFTNISMLAWVTADGSTNLRNPTRLLDFAMPDTNNPPGRAGGLTLNTRPASVSAMWGGMTQQVGVSWESFLGNYQTGLVAGTVAPSPLLLMGNATALQTPKGVTNLPPLALLADTDNRIGSSLGATNLFVGSLAEVRLYEGLLSSYDGALIARKGADVVPPLLGELRRIRAGFSSPLIEPGDPQPTTVMVAGDFTGASNVDLVASGLVTLRSSSTIMSLESSNQVIVTAQGNAYLLVISSLTQSTLATFRVPIAGPQQLRLDLPATAYSIRTMAIPFSVRGDFLFLTNVDVTGNSLVYRAISDSNVLAFTSGSTLSPRSIGTATLSAWYSNAATAVALAVTNPAGTAATWPRLIHRWQLNEPAGTWYCRDSINDRILAGRYICRSILGGGTTPVGTQPRFDGTSAYLSGYTAFFSFEYGLLQGLTNCTVELWVRCNVARPYYRVFDMYQPANPYAVEPTYGQTVAIAGSVSLSTASSCGTGGIEAAYEPGGEDPSGYYRLQAPSALSSAWTHLVWVHSPALGVAELYVDGVQVAATNTALPFYPSMQSWTWLGRNSASPNLTLNGDYDEIRIYDGALSPLQVQATHAAGPDAPSAVSLTALAVPWGVQLQPDGQHAKIRIPNPRSGVILETSPTLGSDAVWTAVTAPVQVEPDETTSVEVPVGAGAFFRLRLPQ